MFFIVIARPMAKPSPYIFIPSPFSKVGSVYDVEVNRLVTAGSRYRDSPKYS